MAVLYHYQSIIFHLGLTACRIRQDRNQPCPCAGKNESRDMGAPYSHWPQPFSHQPRFGLLAMSTAATATSI